MIIRKLKLITGTKKKNKPDFPTTGIIFISALYGIWLLSNAVLFAAAILAFFKDRIGCLWEAFTFGYFIGKFRYKLEDKKNPMDFSSYQMLAITLWYLFKLTLYCMLVVIQKSHINTKKMTICWTISIS